MKLSRKIICSSLLVNLPIYLYTMTSLSSCTNGLIEKNDKLTCNLKEEEKIKKINITNNPVENRISNFNISFSKKDSSITNEDLKNLVFNVDLIIANKYIEIAQCHPFSDNDTFTIEITYWIRLSVINQDNDQETLFNIIAVNYDKNWKQTFEGFKICVHPEK